MSLRIRDLRNRFRVHLAPARAVTTHVERSFSDEARGRRMSGLNRCRLIKGKFGICTTAQSLKITDNSSSESVLADLRAACLLDASRCLCSEACDGMDQQTASCGGSYTQPGYPAGTPGTGACRVSGLSARYLGRGRQVLDCLRQPS